MTKSPRSSEYPRQPNVRPARRMRQLLRGSGAIPRPAEDETVRQQQELLAQIAATTARAAMAAELTAQLQQDAAARQASLDAPQQRAREQWENQLDAEQQRRNAESDTKKQLRERLSRREGQSLDAERAERRSATVSAVRQHAQAVAKGLRDKGITPVRTQPSTNLTKETKFRYQLEEPVVVDSYGVAQRQWEDRKGKNVDVFIAQKLATHAENTSNPRVNRNYLFDNGFGIDANGELVSVSYNRVHYIEDQRDIQVASADGFSTVLGVGGKAVKTQDPFDMLLNASNRGKPGDDADGAGYLATFTVYEQQLNTLYETLTGTPFTYPEPTQSQAGALPTTGSAV